MYMCIYLSLYIYIYIHTYLMYIYIYIYIYTHNPPPLIIKPTNSCYYQFRRRHDYPLINDEFGLDLPPS